MHGHKCTGLIDCTVEKIVCGLMSGIEFKTTCHSSKNRILFTMQRFKSDDTFVYAQSYVFKKLLENIFKNSSGGLLEIL